MIVANACEPIQDHKTMQRMHNLQFYRMNVWRKLHSLEILFSYCFLLLNWHEEISDCIRLHCEPRSQCKRLCWLTSIGKRRKFNETLWAHSILNKKDCLLLCSGNAALNLEKLKIFLPEKKREFHRGNRMFEHLERRLYLVCKEGDLWGWRTGLKISCHTGFSSVNGVPMTPLALRSCCKRPLQIHF